MLYEILVPTNSRDNSPSHEKAQFLTIISAPAFPSLRILPHNH